MDMLLTRKGGSKGRGSPRPRSRARSRAGSRPPARAERPGPRELLGRLEQRHLDLIGLGLVAIAVYLGFVLYVGWDGGPVGNSLKSALTDATGRVAYLVPLAVAGWGVALVMRPLIKAPGALNAGAILLLAALLLAFAAETAGLGAAHPERHGYFDQRFYSGHGGVLGEALYWAATSLFHRLGAQILAVSMFVCGLLLVTQTTVSNLLTRAARMARTAGAGTRDLAKTVRLGGAGGIQDFEPNGRDIAITRAGTTDVLGPDALGRDEAGDEDTLRLADGEPEWDDDGPEAPGAGQFAYEETAAPAEEEDALESPAEGEGRPDVELTPMGNRRSGVTESDEIDYRLPGPKTLERGKGDPGPDMRACWASSAGRTSAGTSSSSRPAPRSPRSRSSATTWLTRSPPPTSASSHRSPARRRWGSRCRTSAGGSCAWATSTTAARRGPRPWRCGSARTSPGSPCGRTWRSCRTLSLRAPRARESRAPSTRCSAPSFFTHRPTRPASCWSTPSASS
jgi:hypothetical protein